MKKTFLKALAALCISAVSLMTVSTSCGKFEEQLNTEVENLQGQIDDLDERLTEVEKLTAKLEALTLRVDALYTLKFSVNDNNELLYSFDGGQNWVSTGIVLVSEDDLLTEEDIPGLCPPCQYVPCDHECPEVSLVDNGTSVTITVNDATFTIEKPMEVEFEVKGGRVFFQPGETKTIALKSVAIEEMFLLGAPEGWQATIVDGAIEAVAPEANPNYYGWGSPVLGDQSGFIKIAAIAADGKTLVGKASVCASYSGVAVYAYNGEAHFEVSESFQDSYYYGVCKKEDYEKIIPEVIKAAYNWDTDYLEQFGQYYTTQVVPISHMLGTPDAPVEPEAGVEYIVWAFIDSYDAEYTVDEVVYCAYQTVEVDFEVTEQLAFDVQIDLSVKGVDSYMAVALPEDSYIGPDSENADWGTSQDNMISSVMYGETYGVVLDSDYTGSIYEICADTQFSATGSAGLGKKCYLLVLPLDGRPMEAYTAADVHTFETQCASATKGGEVTLDAKQVYEYDDYGEMVEVNIYNDIYVEVTPSAGWYAIYNVAMSDEDYATYSDFEELLVDYVINNAYPTLAADQPAGATIYIPFTDLGQGASINYVAIAVDENGQYTEVVVEKFSTSTVEYSEILTLTATAPETLTTNSVTIDVATEGTATAYRYVYFAEDNSTWKWTYGNDPEAAIAALVTNDYSSWSNPSVNVTVEEWDGTVEISGLTYDKTYYFFVAAWDENGNPSVAQCEFTPEFSVGTLVAKDTDEWTAAQPEIKYSYIQDEDGYFPVTVDLKPAEGTTVAIFVNDPEEYEIDVTDNEGVVAALYNTLGTYVVTHVTPEGTVFGYYKYKDEDGDGFFTYTKEWIFDTARIVYAVQLADGRYCEPVVINPFEVVEEPTSAWMSVYSATGMVASSMYGTDYSGEMYVYMDKDMEGAAKEGYATVKIMNSGNAMIHDCKPYVYDESTGALTIQGVTQWFMGTCDRDITFTVAEDRSQMTVDYNHDQQGMIFDPNDTIGGMIYVMAGNTVLVGA